MDVWMYTYMHVLHACMYMHVHVRVRVHMPVHVRVHVHGHVYVHVLGMLLYMYMYVHGYVYLFWLKLPGCHEQPCPANLFLYRELLQSILCVLQHLETQGDRAALLHHLLVQESDQPQTPTQRQILHPSKEELLQRILLLHIASWIQTFDCKKLRRLPMFASKNITTEHRM